MNIILHFDYNEGDVHNSNGENTINLFKPSSMKYSESKVLYEQYQNRGMNGIINNQEDKVLLKVMSPFSDRKNTKITKNFCND
jgi:hypothetical protein